MLRASMYVTDASNSPPGSLLGHPTVIVEPPFELVGQFLTAEVDSTRCPLFSLLPRVLAPGSEYTGGGEGHLLTVRDGVAWLETLFAEPQLTCEVPADDFLKLVQEWRRFVRALERRGSKSIDQSVAPDRVGLTRSSEKNVYPFVPKSSLKLRRGDYWPLKRHDGKYGFCVFLAGWDNMRSGLVIGVLDLVAAEPEIQSSGPLIPIREAAHTHVKTFSATGASVVGNINSRLSREEIESYLVSLGKVSVVWGYLIPLEKVNEPTALV